MEDRRDGGPLFILEDMEACVAAYRRVLAPLGRRIVVARGVDEARDLALAWSDQPCTAALLDERLQDGSGTDLLPLPSRFVPAQSVAVISGFVDAWLAVRVATMQALVIPKPVDGATLVALVRFL